MQEQEYAEACFLPPILSFCLSLSLSVCLSLCLSVSLSLPDLILLRCDLKFVLLLSQGKVSFQIRCR